MTAAEESIICETESSHGEEKEESDVEAGARSEWARVLISDLENESECGNPVDSNAAAA